MVIWLIGKSGSGKTFFAKRIYLHFKKKIKNIFWIDGDEFRKYVTYKLKYSLIDRKRNSLAIQDMCCYLEKKGFFVICSIQSIIRSHQEKNRKLFNKYFQIYIDANDQILIKKNKKKLYNLKTNVVGKNIKFPYPIKSHLVIKNDFKKKNYKTKIIIKKINEFLRKRN